MPDQRHARRPLQTRSRHILLVVLAAGLEEVLAHDDRSPVAGVLVLLGPMT
jgi:hypothetical protein